jgi:hypothetical protein
MPRKLRLEYAGAIYHVLNRGNRRENIFRDDTHRELFMTAPNRGLPQDSMADLRLLPNAEPLSFGHRDPARQPRSGQIRGQPRMALK